MIKTEENWKLTVTSVVILNVKTESVGSTKGEQSLNGTSLWNIFMIYAILVVVRIESNIVTHSTVLVKVVFLNFILNGFTTVQNLKNARNVRNNVDNREKVKQMDRAVKHIKPDFHSFSSIANLPW